MSDIHFHFDTLLCQCKIRELLAHTHGDLNVDDPQSAHDYLTLRQFIQSCPLSESTVRRRIKAGHIPSIQPGGENTKILVPADALERLAIVPVGSPKAKRGKASFPSQKPEPRRRPNWLRGKKI